MPPVNHCPTSYPLNSRRLANMVTELKANTKQTSTPITPISNVQV